MRKRYVIVLQRWWPTAVLVALSACVSVPEQFRGEFSPLTPQAAREGDLGAPIRWGGVILEANPNERQTCFEILSRPLDRAMRPTDSDQTLGRFVACKGGFHDPEVFTRGREVTLTGRIDRLDIRKVGEFDYRYPIVQADFLAMWPERQNVIRYDYDLFYSPWYWHYPHHYPYRPWPRHVTRGKPPPTDLPEAGSRSETERRR